MPDRRSQEIWRPLCMMMALLCVCGSVRNFVEADRRVRFEASLDAAERARLKISSELLAVAVRVLGGRKRAAFFDREEAANSSSAES